MNYIHRLGAVALSGVMLMSALSGCASKTDSTTTPTTTTPPATTGTPDVTNTVVTEFDIEGMTDPFTALLGLEGDTVVATAGDVNITVADYVYWAAYACDTILSQYAAYGISEVPWDQVIGEQTFAQALKNDSINTAALYAVLPVEAQKLGLEVSQDELDVLDLYLEEMTAKMGSEEIMQYGLWEAPTTYDRYRNSMMADSYYTQLYKHYTDEGGEFYVTDDECLAYAEEQGFYGAKHILFKTVSDQINEEGTGYLPLSDDEIAAQKKQAEEVLAQLDASDDALALFDELMNEYSEDGREPETGALYSPDGYVAYPGQMVPEFETAAKELAVGDYSGLVESDFGYHIILRQAIPMSEDYRDALCAESMKTLQDGWLEATPVVTNDVFEQIDLKVFYDNLTAFRTQMDAHLETLAAALEPADTTEPTE